MMEKYGVEQETYEVVIKKAGTEELKANNLSRAEAEVLKLETPNAIIRKE